MQMVAAVVCRVEAERTRGIAGDLVEIDTVEKTCGHIRNLDLYIDETGAAHLLYTKQPHQYEFIRDKYFPSEAMTVRLEHVIVKDGRVLSRQTIAERPAGPNGFEPSFGRFHINSSGQLYVIAAGTNLQNGERTSGNFLARIPTGENKSQFERVDLKHPFGNFFTNTPRGGSKPSDTIDIFGIADDGPNLRYARIRIEP